MIRLFLIVLIENIVKNIEYFEIEMNFMNGIKFFIELKNNHFLR